MARPRDTQQSKVFAAEATINAPQDYANVEAASLAAQKIMRSSWWSKRCQRSISITTTRGTRCPYMSGGDVLLVSAGSRLDLMHSLAHVLTPREVALHGPEFVRNYLNLVERFISKPAKNNLLTIFRAHGVKTSTWSPEAKARAKERTKNPTATPFGLAKLERDRDAVVSLMQDIASGLEKPAQTATMTDGEVMAAARKAAVELLVVATQADLLAATRNAIIGDREPERVLAALKSIIDEMRNQ